MANQDLTRTAGKFKKRGVSIMSASIDTGPNGEYFTSDDVYTIANLPKRCIVTRLAMNIITPNDAGTSAVMDVGFDGGTELVANFDIAGAAAVTVSDENVYLANGGALTLVPTYGGAAATEGLVDVVVEYIELDKVTGELTTINNV